MIVESFFLESKDGIFFDVKGLYQPAGWSIAYARYFPEKCLPDQFLTQGKIRKSRFDEKNYYKFYDVNLRQDLIETCFPDYILPDPRCPDVILQGLPVTAIKRVYNPMEYVYPPENGVINIFLEEIKKLTGVQIGITGSHLIGLNSDSSDLDAVLISTRAKCQSFYRKLDENLGKSTILRYYTRKELYKLYEDRKQQLPSAFTFKKELDKANQGMFELDGKKIDFYIRLVATDENWLHNCSYDVFEKVTFHGTITSSESGILTPAIYTLELDTNCPLFEVIGEEKVYLTSYRGRHAFKLPAGTRVYGSGILEKLKIVEKSSIDGKEIASTYRIVIGGFHHGFLELDSD